MRVQTEPARSRPSRTAATCCASSWASEALGYLLCRVGVSSRRARWASGRAVSCACGRSRAGAARLEASNNAREYSADAARLEVASVRVLDVHPWSGPRLGATVVGVRASGASGASAAMRCLFGESWSWSWAAWRGGVGGVGAGSVSVSGGVRCVSPASLVTGWVGVQLGGVASGALSSGGSFHYHGALAAVGVSPPLGPERGGTRVSVWVWAGAGAGAVRDASTARCRVGNGSRGVLAQRARAARLRGA